jgi:hypothetical protein
LSFLLFCNRSSLFTVLHTQINVSTSPLKRSTNGHNKKLRSEFPMADKRRPNAIATPVTPNHRAALSRATRRTVRQAVALATELDLHSVTVAGCVWTLRHDLHQRRDLPGSKQKQQGNIDGKSKRQQRSETRLSAHRALHARAHEHMARRALRGWLRAAAAGKQQQPEAAAAAIITAVDDAAVAAAAVAAPPPPPQPQPQPPGVLQQRVAMDDERAPKRTPASPLAGDSPSEPRAKRTLALPPGLPPPSAPPSPPSPAPPSPPPSARRVSPRKETGIRGGSAAESSESDPESVSDELEYCIECRDEGVSVPACGVMHFGPNIVPLCQSHAEELSFFMRSYE